MVHMGQSSGNILVKNASICGKIMKRSKKMINTIFMKVVTSGW